MTDGHGTRTPRRRGAVLWVCALLAVVVVGVLAANRFGSDEASVSATSSEVPSPLFDQVEQLTPTSLPDGWARCGGAPSMRPDAEDTWWAQTFGPVAGGECTPLVTVTQVPPDDQVDMPDITDDIKIGGADDDPDAIGWEDEATGSVGLYTWARGQGLMVEACCGADAREHFDAMAVAALEGTREHQPSQCTRPESDLDLEDDVDNYFGSRARMFDRDGCPLRRDIATMETLGPQDHCWPNVVFLVIGTPVGTPYDDTTSRVYVRDPDGLLAGGEPIPDPDLDATLPATAVSTGYSQGERTLWIDESDEEWVYLVSDDGVEAWPRDRRMHGCA